MGKNHYIKLPKAGTNPRGVEITKEALTMLVKDCNTKRISIDWQKPTIEINTYKRWVIYGWKIK